MTLFKMRLVKMRLGKMALLATGLAIGALGVSSAAHAWVAASGPRGGGVVAGPRGGVAVGPNGGVAVAGRPVDPGYGVAVRPPYVATVPVYPGYRPYAPVAAAAAVGLVVGARLATLPTGCSVVMIAGVSYYQCGTTWLRPYMQGTTVTYVVVTAP